MEEPAGGDAPRDPPAPSTRGGLVFLVVTGEEKRPVPGARIGLYTDEGWDHSLADALTEAAGRFELRLLPGSVGSQSVAEHPGTGGRRGWRRSMEYE